MIYGTGVDIIEIKRIQNSLTKFSPRFEEKVFTDNEIKYCQSQADPVKHFAARFAVKEAVSKSLGTGISKEVGLKDIEVVNQDSGKPLVVMNGQGKKLFEKLNLKCIHISISHDKHYAIAQAIAEQ
jgi:holo-[acyl-carrier protein] synthase